jgi:UDP-N-acetylmuramoyl-tripeptide--D-alanyl-D-alanine ligase
MNNNEILEIVLNSKGVSIDSRTISDGQIFFALKGDNFDGNGFAEMAIQNGASYAVVSDIALKGKNKIIYVENTLKTLQNIARVHRQKFDIPIIALTGTNGKTTTKEMIYHLLQSKYESLCTYGNLNNHIGVPLTLLNLNISHQIAVIEMGASAKGDIMELCNIALPTHGLITNIGKAHIEGFGSVETIIETKTELYEYIKATKGIFFFNTTVREISNKLKGNNFDCVTSFSEIDMAGNCIKSLENIAGELFVKIKMADQKQNTTIFSTKVYGEYNFQNIVNASKVADFFEVDNKEIVKGLKEFMPTNNRSQIMDWKSNTLILDAYNANPSSVNKAISSFEKIAVKRDKIIVLGDMLELGNTSAMEHMSVLQRLLDNNIYKLIVLTGKHFSQAGKDLEINAGNCRFFDNSHEAAQFVKTANIFDSLLLAKGSRGIKIENIFL